MPVILISCEWEKYPLANICKLELSMHPKYRRVFDLPSLRLFICHVVCTKSVLNPYTSCSVHECLIIWQAFLRSEGLVRVFTVHRGSSGRSNKKLASSKICFQILFMWQEIHQGKCETHILLFTAISYERKHVSDLSMLVFCFHGHSSWFIYEL